MKIEKKKEVIGYLLPEFEINKKILKNVFCRLKTVNIVCEDIEIIENLDDETQIFSWEENYIGQSVFYIYSDEEAFNNRVHPLKIVNLNYKLPKSRLDLDIRKYILNELSNNEEFKGGEIIWR